MSLSAPVPFSDVFRDLLEEHSNQLGALPQISRAAFIALQNDLLQFLSQTCSLPLLAEFAVFRDCDVRRFHRGGDGVYRDFCAWVQNAGLTDFFKEFPELLRLATNCAGDWRDANREFLLRLQADRKDLTETFGGEATGQVVHLDPSLSDRHRGRAVIGVTFESGLKLAYKPRDMALERSYFSLLHWFNAQGAPVDQRVLKVLERPDYGWVEWIEHESCRSDDDARNYFERAGALQCVFYVLHATDAHMGNVIASGAYPVLVDAECLLQPRRSAGEIDPEREALEDLLSAAFFPRPKPVREDAPDFSGLGGDSGRSTGFRVPVWRDINANSMSLRFVDGILIPQKNAPAHDGIRSELQNYSPEFLAGFERMYRFVADRRQPLLAAGGPLEQMFSCDARVLLRSTRACVSAINRSLHPRYLRDSERRWAMLHEWVAREPLGLSSQILAKEADALGNLNIPYFTTAPNAVTLQAEGGISMPGYFHLAGREIVRQRLESMGDASLQTQLGLLKSLLALSLLPR